VILRGLAPRTTEPTVGFEILFWLDKLKLNLLTIS
jgi:hypothetical protein